MHCLGGNKTGSIQASDFHIIYKFIGCEDKLQIYRLWRQTGQPLNTLGQEKNDELMDAYGDCSYLFNCFCPTNNVLYHLCKF